MWKSDHIETNTIHAGKLHDKQFGSLSTPLYQTSTFTFESVEQGGNRFAGEESGYIYSRLGNPTVTELEERMATLEQCEAAAAFGSGMGAVSATLLAFLKSGDHIITSQRVYGCTFSLMSHQFKQWGIEVSFVDMTNEQEIIQAIKPNTKIVFCETPINPCLTVIDLTMIGRICKQRQLLSVVDNTFMSPVLQNPVKFGIDLIVHSATKFLNGHGDVVAGVVCGSSEHINTIKMTTLKDMGAVMSPHDAWLIIRGLKTLTLRVKEHCSNALQVAEYLDSHSMVAKVYYPGLDHHPGHALIGNQMKAAGGVLAFELRGSMDDAIAFMNQLKMCKIAVSLGDAETLVQHPASMTHSTYTEEERLEAGIKNTLIRLSAGLEHIDDIIADLKQALEASFAQQRLAS